MAEYIDKSELYKEIAELEELARKRVVDTPTNSQAYARYVAQLDERTMLKHKISDTHAADVAPVVRCKDCRYSGFDPEYGKRWCERCWGSMLAQDDDFCSYGEKREV